MAQGTGNIDIWVKVHGEEALQRLQMRMATLSSTVLGLVGNLASLAFHSIVIGAAAAAGAIAGLTVSYVALGRAVLGYNATMEKSKVAFSAVFRGPGEAEGALKLVREYARETTAQFQELIQAVPLLKATGVEFIKWFPTDPTRVLRAAGDLSAAVQKTFGDAIFAIKEAVSENNWRSMMMRMSISKGMISRILREHGEKGDIPTGSSEQDMKTRMERITRFIEIKYGGLQKAMSFTWTGIMSNLGDQLMDFMTRVGEAGFFGKMKAALKGVFDYFQLLFKTGEINKFVNALNTILTPLANIAGALSQGLIKMLESMRTGDLEGWATKIASAVDRGIFTIGRIAGGAWGAFKAVWDTYLKGFFDAKNEQDLNDAWFRLGTAFGSGLKFLKETLIEGFLKIIADDRFYRGVAILVAALGAVTTAWLTLQASLAGATVGGPWGALIGAGVGAQTGAAMTGAAEIALWTGHQYGKSEYGKSQRDRGALWDPLNRKWINKRTAGQSFMGGLGAGMEGGGAAFGDVLSGGYAAGVGGWDKLYYAGKSMEALRNLLGGMGGQKDKQAEINAGHKVSVDYLTAQAALAEKIAEAMGKARREQELTRELYGVPQKYVGLVSSAQQFRFGMGVYMDAQKVGEVMAGPANRAMAAPV